MKTTVCLWLTLLVCASPQLHAGEVNSFRLADADNAFAFKLLKQLSAQKPGASIFVSPYSAATALQMVANGAAGQTKTEMQQVLETGAVPSATVNESTKLVTALLNSGDTNIILSTANGLWYQQGLTIKSAFLKANQDFFSSAIQALDFHNASAAEATINQWASDQTHGRIQGIADGLIHPGATDLILANAIYFKANWLLPFDPKLTKERSFHPATGSIGNVPMMEKNGLLDYRRGSGYQAVQLRYTGYNLAMYLFLPDPGSTPVKLLQIMNATNWQRVTVPGFSQHRGTLVFPKFKLENTLDLNPPLTAMGMKSAFNQGMADFSAMFETPRGYFVSAVRQMAFVEVNEQGTEAAAVTGISMTHGYVEDETPFSMIVDRPFLFAIADTRTDLILFIGIVNAL